MNGPFSQRKTERVMLWVYSLSACIWTANYLVGRANHAIPGLLDVQLAALLLSGLAAVKTAINLAKQRDKSFEEL